VRFGEAQQIDFDDWFVPASARHRRVESSVDNFAALPSLLIGTQRVATLHSRMAQHFARYLPLRVVRTPFKLPPVVETMTWPPHLEHDPAHIWLRRAVEESALGNSGDCSAVGVALG
jgi:DNA-binding transcriptional LysR family regulator